MEQLRSNPYTYKVTTCQIFFTAEFKERFYQLRQEGLLLNEVITMLGYDPDVLEEKRHRRHISSPSIRPYAKVRASRKESPRGHIHTG